MTIQDRPPNFRDEKGQLFLLRCYRCDPDVGIENWYPNVKIGICAWCGWVEPEEEKDNG